MSALEQRHMTRAAAAAAAAAAASAASCAENAGRQAPHLAAGKRPQQSGSSKGTTTGSKKGRSAPLEDITNRSRQPSREQGASKADAASRTSQSVPEPEPQQAANPFSRARQAQTASDTRSSCLQQGGYVAHSSFQLTTPAHIDIDAISSLLGCPDYVVSIFENLREAELRRRPSASYMETVQSDVNISMRHILVDWLVEVAQEYRLVSDTLFLAVSYIDRYLSQRPVPRSKLQLVGITCLLLASKYEEIYAPQVDQFVYITDNTYTRQEILAMEEQVLAVLDFELTAPTAKTFLRRFIQAAMAGTQPDARLEHLAAYLVELALCEYGCLQYLPSQLAAAAVLVAQYTLGSRVWSPTLQHYSGFSPLDLHLPARVLQQLAAHAYGLQMPPASREKFASPRYKGVSLLRPPESLPDWLFTMT